MHLLGIDVGGSGIKGALINKETGELVSERFRLPTPKGRKPNEIAETINQIIKHFNYHGPIGCGFPTIIKNGVCRASGNLHSSWLGVNVTQLLKKTTGQDIVVINDADAAGLASMKYGVGKGKKGLVIMITVGTGLGSGAFLDGKLLPNFELGQIPYKSYKKIEDWAANSAKEKENLSYEKWVKRFNKFLRLVEIIVAPDLIIIGGGISKNWALFGNNIELETEVVQAELMNHAGIIGAAIASQS